MKIPRNKNVWDHPCTYDGGKMVKEYQEWNAIKGRCKKDSNYQKEKPSYVGCYRDEVFSDYDLYFIWRNQQIGAGMQDSLGRWFVPEKDLLVLGNKCYGIDFVVYVPLEINGFFTRHTRQRSEDGKGVYKNGSGYSAVIGSGERSKVNYLGLFKTREGAQQAHNNAKNERAKLLAERWKEYVDPRVYGALLMYDETERSLYEKVNNEIL